MSQNWERLVGEEVRSELVQLSEQKGITRPVISFKPGSTLGDNYLGEIVNVIIEDDNGEQNGKKNLDLIVKCAPRSGVFREKVPIHQFYIREMYAYNTIFKEYLKLQKDCNIKEIFNPFAVCYKTIPSNGFETLIMKNMKSIGYYMENRMKPLDYDHVYLVIRSYGKLHALSFALRERDPEKFRELADNLAEQCFDLTKLPDDYYDNLTKPVSDLLEEPLKGKFDSFRSNLEYILKNELCEETPGKYSVIGHGDSWTNNFLFKNEDFGLSSKPTSVIFLDWQLSRMSSPFADIFYFLFVCTDKQFRDKHFNNLIDEYYESFSEFLKELGCDPGRAFPRDIFDEHMKMFMGFGLYMALSLLKIMLSKKDDVFDYKNMTEEELEKSSKELHKFQAETGYAERIIDVIIDAQKYGSDGQSTITEGLRTALARLRQKTTPASQSSPLHQPANSQPDSANPSENCSPSSSPSPRPRMTINSQSGPRSTRPSEDLITTATSALRRLHFKTGRGITKANAKTQVQTPVPKVVLMGSSTASETTINTSTDSSNTMITTMTATDGETTDGHDSLEINDSFDILNLDNNQLEGGIERGAHCIIPVTMSPKTPTTVKHERQFTFDVMDVATPTPQTACCKKNDTFVFDTLLQNDEICMQEEKSVEKIMKEQQHEVKQPNGFKPVKTDPNVFRPSEDVISRNVTGSKDMLRGSSSEESKSSTTTKAESDGGRSSSSSRTQSTVRVKPRRSMSVDKTGHDYRLEVKSTVSLDRGGIQAATTRTKHRHKKRHHSSSAKNKVERFTYDEKHISKYREQARMTPPLPDLRVDFFNESAESNAATAPGPRDSLLIPVSHEKRGSVCLNKCILDVGAQLEASSTINVTTNPLENSVRFGGNSRGTRQPQATIVVQQPSVSLDHSGVSTILLKNGSDFVSNVETAAKVKEENVKQLLDVSNNLTMEEIHDFEMRYGSPHHSRSQSVKTPGRSSGRPNYLCLPQQRSRVASMPNTGVEEEYYRLRHFSITGKGIVNRGDSLKSRRSRSNNSVASSNSSTEQLPTAVSATGSCRTSASCSLASSRESSTSAPGPTPYKVLMLGGPAVGKSSLVSQFMTSEYLHAYDTSIDDESGEKSVSVLLAGEESELIFIDFATADLSPETCINKYQDPHAYCVVYSSADRSSLVCAERILQTLWMMDNISTKAVILVANKADLVRSRVVSTEEGKSVATNFECKYIETSVGINHNVDELLVGILTQIRLKLENPERTRDIFRKRSSSRKNFSRNKSPVSGTSTPTGSAQNSPKKYRGSRTSASLKVRSLLGRVWARDSKSKSCENLHVL